MSLAAKGKVISTLTRQKISKGLLGRPPWNKNKKHSPEHIEKVRLGLIKLFDKKGRKTTANSLIRSSTRYKNWRTSVFERDNYTCQVCNKIGVYLNAHHIKKFSDFPELRFEISNGITLCKSCHDESRNKEVWYEEELIYLKALDEHMWDLARVN